MRYYAVEKLGPKRALTPEGFLLCYDVPLCRTGELVYGASELPAIAPGSDGFIRVTRAPEDVFTEEHIASYAGKPFVNDHPDDPIVDLQNWRAELCGVVMNPRRGTGMNSDVLLGDIIVYDAGTIKQITEDDKVEVSCGYDADFEETSRGMGRQVDLIGNHVALVTAGRCGPRCAINDSLTEGAADMKFRDEQGAREPVNFADRINAAITAGDTKAAQALAAEAQAHIASLERRVATRDDGSEVHIHLPEAQQTGTNGAAPAEAGPKFMTDEDFETKKEEMKKEMKDSLMEAMQPFSDALEEIREHIGLKKDTADAAEEERTREEIREETGATKDAKFTDSVELSGTFQQAASMAEILAPGITLPRFNVSDAAADTYRAINRMRRTALDLAYGTPEGRAVIDDVAPQNFDGDFAKLPNAQVRTIFAAAASARKQRNNYAHDAGRNGSRARDNERPQGQPAIRSIADLNALHRERRWR